MEYRHTSAMPDEVLHYLDVKPDGIYVDGTLGGAGHAGAICKRLGENGTFIGIDQDTAAIDNAKIKLATVQPAVHLIHDNFANLPHVLSELNLKAVDGILIDIGLSQYQLDGSGRGFSFSKAEPLDMRMNVINNMTASDIVNTWDARDLVEIFFKFGEEKFSRQVARRIIEARGKKMIETSFELAEIIKAAIPVKAAKKQKIHPATRVFQAIRIAVNDELGRLQAFMDQFHHHLNPKGRLVVLSFHSLEDRIVKKGIRSLEIECECPKDFPKCVCNKERVVKALTRKAIAPTKEEVDGNPMARSTKLRACEKI